MALLHSDPKTLQKGDKAPDFSIKNIDEKIITLKDYENKPLVIIFMCNHCPYVKPKMQTITNLQKKFDDVAFVLVNSNDPEYNEEDNFENMKKIAKQYNYNIYAMDETQKMAKTYGAVCTPDIYVFNKEHKLYYRGRIDNAMNPQDEADEETLKEVLQALQKEKELTEWFKPSMGCSIKWKTN